MTEINLQEGRVPGGFWFFSNSFNPPLLTARHFPNLPDYNQEKDKDTDKDDPSNRTKDRHKKFGIIPTIVTCIDNNNKENESIKP